MTNEERTNELTQKAKESYKIYSDDNCVDTYEGYQYIDGYCNGYEQGYEDCIHYAHDYYKPKWHDLRKDPNDLPTKTGHYLTDDGEYVYDAFHRKWRTIACMTCWDLRVLDDGEVIAWCELPTFEE